MKREKVAELYADTFEYGFMVDGGNFLGGEVHIDNEEGLWICEIYGINGDDFDACGFGDDFREAVNEAMLMSGLNFDAGEEEDLISHIEFRMSEQHFGGIAANRKRAFEYDSEKHESQNTERHAFTEGFKSGLQKHAWVDWPSLDDTVRVYQNMQGKYEVNWGSIGSVSIEDAREFANYILDICESPEEYCKNVVAGSKKHAASDEDIEYLYELKYALEDAGYSVRTFDEVGLLTNNLGLVIDGNQFEWLGSW